jgi:HEPN domain-containing protein
MDVAREGIALYQADDSELHQPKPKTPEQALAMAKEYFEEWFPSGGQFYRQFQHAMTDRAPKIAAFDLHQATERLYHTILLVLTFYTPHVHNLEFLRTQAERLDRRLFNVWPRDSKKDRAAFEKLKDAYVKARYSKHYQVTESQLIFLGERVEELGQIVSKICYEQIERLSRN